MISYEYPLSERIRTLLRLEDLYERLDYFLEKNEPLQHHVALLLIFEIYEVASRADLKSDLLQELERQKQVLRAFRNNPDISEDALNQVLGDMEQASTALFGMTGRIGQYLRENEWLMSIKQRTGILERRHAPPEMATSDLCVEAARRAIRNANVDPADIDLVVCGTFTPDFQCPSTACLIQPITSG